ncbi:MAG: flavodoxin, partial [Bacteriovorax sp.]|nr:flavodoxin [Bacteriovorax sp.]
MNKGKILVLYFSNSGYTKKLANEISQNLMADLEEIKTSVSYTGFLGYQRALLHSIFKKEPKINGLHHQLTDYDIVIVGSPVWAATVASPINSFLKNNKENI